MEKWRRYTVAAITVSVSVLFVANGILPSINISTIGIAHAAGQSCQVTDLSPHNPDSGTETGFAFTITSDDQVGWIRIISPSSDLTIDGGSSDWLPTVSYTGSQATFSGAPISSGNPLTVEVDAEVNYFPSSYWVVQTATDSSGTDRVNCSGDTSITVSNSGPPSITSISASALTTSATILWTTDKASNSTVDYGFTSSYGKEATNGALVTSHNIHLTGLIPGHAYHYQVTSTDNLGQGVSSNDGTFFTAAGSSGGGGSGSSGGTTTPPVGTSGGKSSSSDKTAPTVHITSDLPNVTATTPTVYGMANDNTTVKKIEYSIDGGRNWLSVDHTSGLGSASASFNFTPLNLEDDTYSFVVRAIDASGNSGTTKPVQVVIDRLPPAVGSSVITVGSQIIEPDERGVITTLTGVGLTITLSTSGGASMVNVEAVDVRAAKTVAASFALTRDTDSGLWHGTLSFSQAGYYRLVVRAVDGADNTVTRAIANVAVTRPALVLSPQGPVAGATATVYYLDPDTNDWILWDSRAYGQANPTISDTSGAFAVLLPTGTYYIAVAAKGYLPVTSNSFTVHKPTPLASVFQLKPSSGLNILWWPLATVSSQSLTSNLGASTFPTAFVKQPMIGKALPGFSLTDTAGTKQNPIEWLGKPTIVTVMSTWTPTAAEQVSSLEALSANHDINVELIGMQENAARLEAFDSIAGSTMPWIADPDGSLSAKLVVGSAPMHFFVDRDGTIRRVVNGPLSTQEMTAMLTGVQ